MTRTPIDVSDARFTRLREKFTEAERVELSSAIAWESYRARLDHAFGIEAENFSAGAVCALPVRSAANHWRQRPGCRYDKCEGKLPSLQPAGRQRYHGVWLFSFSLPQFLAVSSRPEQQPFIPFLSQLPPQRADASGLFRGDLCCRHHCSKKSRFVVARLHAGHRVLVRSHLFAVLGLHVVMRTAGSSSFGVSGGHLVAARTLRLVGGNRALLRGGTKRSGLRFGPTT